MRLRELLIWTSLVRSRQGRPEKHYHHLCPSQHCELYWQTKSEIPKPYYTHNFLVSTNAWIVGGLCFFSCAPQFLRLGAAEWKEYETPHHSCIFVDMWTKRIVGWCLGAASHFVFEYGLVCPPASPAQCYKAQFSSVASFFQFLVITCQSVASDLLEIRTRIFLSDVRCSICI